MWCDMLGELKGKIIKCVWLDNLYSKVVIGQLVDFDFERGFISIKTAQGQQFIIKISSINSLFEYIGGKYEK